MNGDHWINHQQNNKNAELNEKSIKRIVLNKNLEKLSLGFKFFFHIWTVQQKKYFLDISNQNFENESKNYEKNIRIVLLLKEVIPLLSLYDNKIVSIEDFEFLKSIVDSVENENQI